MNIGRLVSFSNHDGAMTSIFAATSREIVENGIRGEYLMPVVGWNMRFAGVTVSNSNVSKVMKDPKEGEKLWDACEKAVYGKADTV